MAILFAGNEETDFINVSSALDYYSNNVSFAYRTNLVRGALWVYNVSGSTTPGWIRTPTLQTTDNPIWFSARMGYPSSAYANGGAYLRFFSGPNIVAELRANANNSVSLFMRNSSGAMAFVAETAPRVFTYFGGGDAEEYAFKFDYNLNLNATTGHFRMYLGGKAVINYSGNTLGDLAPTTRIDQVHLGTGRTSTGGLVWSEIIVASTDTRAMALMSLPPTSLNFNQWTGTVTDINENIMNTSTNLSSITADQVANIKIKPITDTPIQPFNMEVQALVVSGSYSTNGSSPSTIAVGHSNANGTTTAYTTPFTPPTGSYGVFAHYFDQNYIDNAKWTPTSLASMHISLKSG